MPKLSPIESLFYTTMCFLKYKKKVSTHLHLEFLENSSQQNEKV